MREDWNGRRVVPQTIQLADETVASLQELADKRGMTLAEFIRVMIRDQLYLLRERERGSKVLVVDRNNSYNEIHIGEARRAVKTRK